MRYMEFFKRRTNIISVAVLLLTFVTTMTLLYTNNAQTKLRSSAQGTTQPATDISSNALSPTPLLNVFHQPVYIGMWTQDFWDESVFRLRPDKLIAVENTIGKRF